MDKGNLIGRLHSIVSELLNIISDVDSKPDIADDNALNPYIMAVDSNTGAAKLVCVEALRQKLLKSDNALDIRFANSLPQWWYVQDLEEYVNDYTEYQNQLQEFNCARARFLLANTGANNTRELLYRSWIPAIIQKPDPRTDISTVIELPLYVGEAVESNRIYAVASDSVINGVTKTLNPRVEDMPRVINAAYAYFIKTNANAVHNVSELR